MFPEILGELSEIWYGSAQSDGNGMCKTRRGLNLRMSASLAIHDSSDTTTTITSAYFPQHKLKKPTTMLAMVQSRFQLDIIQKSPVTIHSYRLLRIAHQSRHLVVSSGIGRCVIRPASLSGPSQLQVFRGGFMDRLRPAQENEHKQHWRGNKGCLHKL